MNETSVAQYITESFENVQVVTNEGSYFFFYGPMADTNKFPFATLVTNDDHDDASNLNRPDVFRLNIGVSKTTFQNLFGAEDTNYDFTTLDQIMPHPVYGMMYWVCVLNPSDETFKTVKQLLDEAYQSAVKTQTKKQAKSE